MSKQYLASVAMSGSPEKKSLIGANSRIFQNSYRLNPKQSFDVLKVKTHIKNIMDMNFQETEYSEQFMKDICVQLVDEIRTAVKAEDFDRCRLVVNVIIGQKKMQGLHTTHSFLWDHERDKYAEHVFENNNFFVQAVVYGIYMD